MEYFRLFFHFSSFFSMNHDAFFKHFISHNHSGSGFLYSVIVEDVSNGSRSELWELLLLSADVSV